jgi:hypothetical protein
LAQLKADKFSHFSTRCFARQMKLLLLLLQQQQEFCFSQHMLAGGVSIMNC